VTFETYLRTVGKTIAALRKAKALRQKEAAEKADISYRYYQTIEAGSANLTLSTVYRIADFLKVHPARILCPEHAAESRQ
jgi:transcriptional regulator with XRE-family HTH domain